MYIKNNVEQSYIEQVPWSLLRLRSDQVVVIGEKYTGCEHVNRSIHTLTEVRLAVGRLQSCGIVLDLNFEMGQFFGH